MHPSITRYLHRHRDQIASAIAAPLAKTLGAGRAGEEGSRLVAGLENSLQSPDPGLFLGHLRECVGRWSDAGAHEREIGEALLGLIRARTPAVDTPETRDWQRELRPLLEFIPTPTAFVDSRFRILFANAAFLQLSREPEATLPGVPLHDLLVGMDETAPPSFGGDGLGRPGWLQLGRVRLRSEPGGELLASRVPFAPGGQLVGWFVTLAPGASEIIAEATLNESLEYEKRQKEKFSALLTVSNAVVNTLELNTILMTIARQVRQVIQTDECTVFLYDPRDQVLVPAVCDARTWVEEMMAIRLKLGEGITGMVAATGRGEIVNDAEGDPRALTVPGTPPEQTALLCVPLQTHDRVVGVITLTRVGGRGFNEEDLELATLFAGQCTAAIANARLYEDVKRAYDELRHTQAQLVQSAKLNALGEMAGGVAHDFNNILASILGRTQLLMQTHADPDLRRQLSIIEQAALDGAHTVRRVQEFTRVRQDEHFETLDMNQVLLGVIELTRPAWESATKRRGVNVDVHLELCSTQPMAGNASELREVFTNLVLNAVDAMPQGGEVWVRSENGPEVVRVQVRDNGVGMEPDTLAKVFDPFFTTKQLKGTGLGLSVAYGIVSRHRGTIEVDSEPGVGTIFTLIFPVGAVEPVLANAGDNPSLPRMRVLVVDDEPTVLDVLADLLAAMGMDVTPALGGRAGLTALEQGHYDVVFTDLGMPDVNGWDLALAAHAGPGTAVVLVTGWGFQLEGEAAASQGVDLVMSKPFTWGDVEGALRQVAPSVIASRAA